MIDRNGAGVGYWYLDFAFSTGRHAITTLIYVTVGGQLISTPSGKIILLLNLSLIP